MSNSIAKLILEKARTDSEREVAIQVAMALGMPLHEIEDYLDWLDAVRSEGETQEGNSSESEE